MANRFWEKLKNASRYFWIFLAILCLGIFLRAYHFHDLLRFNADQSRDAGVVYDLVNHRSSFLILGPQAGGTKFRLGPIFYYFQFSAAKIFGMFPDKIAYPDLIFSIAAIFVIYFLSREYFNRKISILITLIASCSAFAVRYSRFAWNPNSTSFFVPLFLFSLYKLGKESSKQKLLWAVVCGATLGIGFQLHTFLMVIMPLTLIIFFAYLWRKKIFSLKLFLAICLVAVIFNIPQAIYEAKTNGSNTKEFFRGLKSKSNSDNSSSGLLTTNLSKNFFCNAEANWNIVTSLGTSDQCGLSQLDQGYSSGKNNTSDLAGFLGGSAAVIFFLGGIVFLIYYFRKEEDSEKKKLLFLMNLYFVLSFGIFLLFAKELSLRYFMLILFEPIFILGLWIKFIWEKFGKNKIIYFIPIAMILLFGALNVQAVVKTFDVKATKFENTTLGEVEFLAVFIENNTPSGSIAYVNGNSQDLFKLFKSMQFIASTGTGTKMVEYSNKSVLDQNSSYFYIGRAGQHLSSGLAADYDIQNSGTLGHFTIFELKLKQNE